MWASPTFLDTDFVTRVAIVQGYNTNTYQSQDDPSVPYVRRHPSPFTGADANLELRFPGRDADGTSINLVARANHYEPFERADQSDDGSVTGSLSSHLTLGPRTTLTLTDGGTVTSFNASHVTDGTIFAFDPTQVRSTYWLNDFGASLVHQLSRNWRLTQSVGATVSGTLDTSPTQLAGGQLVEHRGLDYVTPYVETDISKDFSLRSAGDLMVLYQYAWQLFVEDLRRTRLATSGPTNRHSSRCSRALRTTRTWS
jgi:hypothetical protein